MSATKMRVYCSPSRTIWTLKTAEEIWLIPTKCAKLERDDMIQKEDELRTACEGYDGSFTGKPGTCVCIHDGDNWIRRHLNVCDPPLLFSTALNRRNSLFSPFLTSFTISLVVSNLAILLLNSVLSRFYGREALQS